MPSAKRSSFIMGKPFFLRVCRYRGIFTAKTNAVLADLGPKAEKSRVVCGCEPLRRAANRRQREI